MNGKKSPACFNVLEKKGKYFYRSSGWTDLFTMHIFALQFKRLSKYPSFLRVLSQRVFKKRSVNVHIVKTFF